MKAQRFEASRGPDWDALESDLNDSGGSAGFPARLRRVARDLALARHRAYGVGLVDRLNDLSLRAHARLHVRPPGRLADAADELLLRFPSAVRREWALVLLAAALFWGPMWIVAAAVERSPDLALSIVDPDTLGMFEEMYDPETIATLHDRGFGGDLGMFGYYIWNNVGIAFRCFASGAAFAAPAAVIVVWNGLYMGAIEGHLAQAGMADQLGTFTASHGAFELSGIVLAAAAGLRLGVTLAAPGRRSRATALREAAARVRPMLWGAAVLLTMAAGIEAFWSSSPWIPPAAKHAMGAACWLLMAVWLVDGSRRAR